VLDLQDSALGVFLDIEGAFNYTTFDSKSTALGRHRVSSSIFQWIRTTLEGCLATAANSESPRKMAVSRGCPQGGVLSPTTAVVPHCRLFLRLKLCSVCTQGYADCTCLLALDKFPETVRAHTEDHLHC